MEKDRDFMVKNSYTSVSTFIKSMLNKTIAFSRKKTHQVLNKKLCIKAVINIEDKCLLNIDKYHYELNISLVVHSIFTTSQLTLT